MPIRVLYIVSTLARCGPVNVLYGIIKHLDRSKFEPVILTLSTEGKNSRWSDFKALGFEIRSLGISRLTFLMSGRRSLRGALADIAPDILHTHGLRADVAASKVRKSIPHVTTIHNDPNLDYLETYGRLLGALAIRRHTSVLTIIEYPVVVANHIKLSLQLDAALVIYNGIDIHEYSAHETSERSHIRSMLGIDENSIVLVYTGVITPRKNLSMLIDVLKHVAPEKQTHLLIVGDGPMLDDCKARSNNSVTFTGQVSNVQQYLEAADVYVSCSRTEGLPMSVIEGMSSGLYAILSNIPGHAEILDIDNNAGELFDLNRQDDLRDILTNLSSATIAQGKIAARSVVRDHFSSSMMSLSYQALYSEILNSVC